MSEVVGGMDKGDGALSKHENGNMIWFGFHVQYECKHCKATLNYLHSSGEFVGASIPECTATA